MSIFNKTSVEKRPFSNFPMSHEWKGSMNMGYLVPIDVVECLPNDTLVGNTEAYVQFAPLVYPIMHRIDCKIYHFFVPNRILWKFWQDFIYEAKDQTRFPKPYVSVAELGAAGQLQVNTLSDYMGLPVEQFLNISPAEWRENAPQELKDEHVDVMPMLAYQKIWNDYFRDENLEKDLFEKDEEIDPQSLYFNYYEHRGNINPLVYDDIFTLRKKAWEKDYFTSALPEPLYGDPQPVPVTGNASFRIPYNSNILKVYTNAVSSGVDTEQMMPGLTLSQTGEGWKSLNMAKYTETSDNLIRTEITPNVISVGQAANAPAIPVNIDGLQFTISDLRLASAIQRMQEALARAGHRYKEAMITMYNQVTPDFRLDRPEFIASANIPVVIGAVAQTSSTDSESAQGNLAGRASVYGSNNGFRYHTQEHGWFITLACVMPRTSYANGLHRMWTRFDRYDYHNPYFEEIGDQAVKKKELYLSYNNPDDNANDFGYSPRYSDYKTKVSTVHGDFVGNLSFMTLTRFFGEDYVANLNSDFIRPDDETTNRAFAVRSEVQNLWCTFYNKLRMRRCMKKNPIPRLM